MSYLITGFSIFSFCDDFSWLIWSRILASFQCSCLFSLVQQSRIVCGSGKRGFAIAIIYIRAAAGVAFGPVIAVLSLELGMILTFSMFGFGWLLMVVLFLMFSRAFLRQHNLGPCQGNTQIEQGCNRVLNCFTPRISDWSSYLVGYLQAYEVGADFVLVALAIIQFAIANVFAAPYFVG